MMAKEAFWSRWSRRKRAARAARSRSNEDSAEWAAPQDAVTLQPGRSEEQTKHPVLPDVRQLERNSDFSVFMSEGVEPLIQRAALRKLWALEPGLAELDGLVDYGEDYAGTARIASTLHRVARAVDHVRSTDAAPPRDDAGGNDTEDRRLPPDSAERAV